MDTTLATLDKELDKQLNQIEQLESDLFFRRIRAAGLKSAKEAILRELITSGSDVKQGNRQSLHKEECT